MEFRHDINAMRGLAVIGVLLFHFLPETAPGGYVGVDTFFVISGFLMTSIIVGATDRGSFTLLSFYMSRVNRIVPALAVVCATLAVLGWFFLPPRDYAQLALHAGSSVTFLSNFVYWMQADYFDAAAHEKWLLHTWSLSVEWHFYLLYPLLVMAVIRVLGRDRLKHSLGVLLVLGAAGSFALAYKAPVTAFYLLPARVWELLAGAMVFLAAPKVPAAWRRPLAYAGIICVVACFWLVDGDTPWPGPMALLPVAGTAAVIAACANSDPLFVNRPAAWLGRISYSLYLWHWPIAVLGNYLQVSGQTWFVITGLAASVLLGAMSFHFIEERRAFYSIRARSWPGAMRSPVVIGAGLVAIACGAIYAGKGIPSRASAHFEEAMALQTMPMRGNGYCSRTFNLEPQAAADTSLTECRLGDRNRPVTGLLFGDSYAASYEPFWDETGKDMGFALHSATTNWCFPAFSHHYIVRQRPKARVQCRINRDFVQRDGGNYRFAIFAANWSRVLEDGFMDDVEQAAIELAGRGTKIIIMPSPIYYDTDVDRRFATAAFNRAHFDVKRIGRGNDVGARAGNERLARFAARHEGIYFIDRDTLFGTRETYRHGGFDVPISLDGHHLSLGGSLDLARSGPTAGCREAVAPSAACQLLKEATAPGN